MPRATATSTVAIAALALVAACARPLTPNETEVARSLFGDTLDTSAVTVTAGIGVLPLPRDRDPGPGPGQAADPVAPPPDICVRKRSTRRTWTWPAAFVLWDDVFFSHDFYRADSFAGFPESVPYPTSLIMAHELVHVWQWQNRARTGYSVQGSAGESVDQVDPYWFVADKEAEFLSYGYEQQGAMVQDFVCYALFDAGDPKLDELAAILRPVLPVDRFLAKLDAAR